MDSPVSPKSPKRQLTLGPSTPIQDWEVERATLLVNYKESREKAERLEKLLQEEQATFEKNTSSLLREVKLKETYLEKKLKDVEESLMSQILALQQRVVDQQSDYQEQIKNLKAEHEQALETESKKYQRRLLSLQERLNAKDKEYSELLEKTNTDEEKDKLIESLRLKIADMERAAEQNVQPIKEEEADNSEETIEDLKVNHQTTADITEYIKREQDYQARIVELEERAQQYKKRLDQVLAGHDAHIQEITEKFMSEAQQSEMSHQARIQNLQSEHADTLRELREQHQTEKEVWSIEQDAAIDELRRALCLEKEDAMRELNKEWKEKYDDLHASMSKDSMEIQAHWEAKLKEAKNQYEAKTARLQGEIEVIKDRLGKEIDRRKQNQAALSECLTHNDILQAKLNDYQTILKQHLSTEKEIHKLKRLQQMSFKKAKEILNTVSPDTQLSPSIDLPELLQLILHKVLIACLYNQVYQVHEDDLALLNQVMN
ncbi:unnamed protein product [Rhizopus microsporus]